MSTLSKPTRRLHRGPATLLLGALMVLAAGEVRAEVSAWLQKARIEPLDPAPVAPGFSLPDLDGGVRRSLEDYRGRWVLLTFFASWCGPCRAEMPSLEALHRGQPADDGLVILGVSTDSTRTAAAAFVSEMGTSFPTLWDDQRQAARDYQAFSIPLSYVVDPTGRLVGVSRGARDWSRLAPLFEALAGDPDAVTSDASAPIDLAEVVNPPTAEIHLGDPPHRPGVPVLLEVAVHWTGAFDEYLLHPPRLFLPEEVEAGPMTASTDSRGGRSVITYRTELTARREGAFAIDPVEVRYTPLLAPDSPQATRLSGPTLEVHGVRVLGLTPMMAASAGLTAIGIGALALLAWRGLDRRREARKAESSVWDGHRAALDRVRRHRLEGEWEACLVGLQALDRELATATGEEPQDFEAWLERVRFAGEKPASLELERAVRDVERKLGGLKPESDEDRLRRRLELPVGEQESSQA